MRTKITIISILSIFVIGLSGVAAQGTDRVANSRPPFPYTLGWGMDGALVAADLGLFGSSVYFQSIKSAPNSRDVDSSTIPFFDLLYTSDHSLTQATVSDILAYTSLFALPAVFVPTENFGNLTTLVVMYGETMGLTYSLAALGKATITRYRPYAYSSSIGASEFSNADIAGSFPSRHTIMGFASATFVGTVYDQLYPDSPYRPAVWGAGLGLAIGTAVLRVTSGEHFLSDVVAGAVLGSLSGWAIPYLHLRQNRSLKVGKVPTVSLMPTPTGFLVDWKLDQ